MRRVFALSVAVVLIASACGGPSGDGPFGKITPSDVIGAPGPIVAIGVDVLTNHTSSPITTQSAVLESPVRLKLVTTFILPLHGNELFGTSHYPVPKSYGRGYSKGLFWSERHVATGAVIKPGEQAQVVAIVRMTGRKAGTAKAVKVFYSQHGHHYYRVGPAAVDAQVPGHRYRYFPVQKRIGRYVSLGT